MFEWLVLGVGLFDVLIVIVCEVICMGMLLIIDLVKIVGLVSLLGMMFGLIFVGVDLVWVIKY